MKEIYEAAESGLYKKVVLVCASQNSKTETYLNILGKRYDINPVAGTIALPTKDLCKVYSKKRLAKLIENSTLRNKCFAKDDQILEKVINGNFLSFAWSTSPNTMCSSPYGFALLDELDRFQEDAHGEGDPVTLIEARGTTFPDFLMLLNSTPTIEGNSAIDREFQKGTKQRLYFICLACKRAFLPMLVNLKWDKDKPETARLECPYCEHKMYDKDRFELIKNYVYLADGQIYEDGKTIGVLPELRTASFWVYGLASPWKSFVDRALSFYEACKKHDQYEIQACVNTSVGELYKVKGDAPDIEELYRCKSGYNLGSVPDRTQILLTSVDCQKNRFYFLTRGFIQGGESFLVDYGETYGEIEDKRHWEDLFRILKRAYKDGKNRDFLTQYAIIDSGYQSHLIYDFCLRDSLRLFPAKGQKVLRAPVVQSAITHNDKTFKLYHINDGYFKEKIYS
jgi:phage terminase large subunit GpA-like protein